MPYFTYYPPTQNGLQKTIDSALATGVTAAATFNNTTGIQNKKGIFVVDRIDANGNLTPTKREYISFTATSGATVTTLTRGLGGSTDQDHAVGAIVEFVPDVVFMQAFIDLLGLVVDVDAGTVNTGTFVTPTDVQTLTNKTLTTPVIASFYQDAGKTKLMTTPNTASDTLAALAATQSFTNKRITWRVGSTTSSANPTINTDNYDMYTLTAQAAAIASFTTNLSGTPTTGQRLVIRIKDDGTARTIAWGASFASRGATLPTTTVLGKVLYVGLIWNEVATVWDCIAVAQEV